MSLWPCVSFRLRSDSPVHREAARTTTQKSCTGWLTNPTGRAAKVWVMHHAQPGLPSRRRADLGAVRRSTGIPRRLRCIRRASSTRPRPPGQLGHAAPRTRSRGADPDGPPWPLHDADGSALRDRSRRARPRSFDEACERHRMTRFDGRFGGSHPQTSCRSKSSNRAKSYLAERVGFEPTGLASTCFQDRTVQPLRHLSAGEDTHSGRSARWPEGSWAIPRWSSRSLSLNTQNTTRRGRSWASSHARTVACATRAAASFG